MPGLLAAVGELPLSGWALKVKPPNPLPPIDLSTLRENLVFDWRDSTIIRWLQFGVASSVKIPMPHEFTPAGGAKIVRRDTGEAIEKPISYYHTPCGSLTYHDDFFGQQVIVTCRVSITPGSPQPKAKPKKPATPVRKTAKTKVDNTQPGMLF